MRGMDLLIAGGIIGLAAWAVVAQVGEDPVGAAQAARPVARLAIGDPLEDQEVVAVSEQRVGLHGLLGKQATVFLSWSTTCPCMAYVNERLAPVIQRTKPLGVTYVAVAGDPKDTPQRSAETLLGMWAGKSPGGLPPYFLVLDPAQRLCRRLGFREAAQFAVVDGNGILRFRGTFDDDLKQPTRTYVPEAIDAVLAGRQPSQAPPPAQRYGCPFGAPVEDCPIVPAK